jgi:hypothetical protein
MGNFVSKRHSNYNTLEMPLLDSYQLTSNHQNSRELLNYIEMLRNEIIQQSHTIEKLEKNIDTISAKYQNNIYTLNEQVNMVNKDLQSLLNNDKLLLEKINNSMQYNPNQSNQPINNFNIEVSNANLNQNLESSKRYESDVVLQNPYYQQHTHRSVTFESPFLEGEEGGPADDGNY